MADKARGEVKLELGGETYVLVPSFKAVCEIEDELDTTLIKLGMKVEKLELRAEELVRIVRVVLEANGFELTEKALAEAIVKEGAATVLVPLVAFVRKYIFGGEGEEGGNTIN